MTIIDWLLVLVINGGIVLYGIIVFRGQRESFDWYLAAKSIPWWIVGLSAFSTAVDSGDYVAIVGGAYTRAITIVPVVAGDCCWLVRPELLRYCADVSIRGIHQRRVA